MDEQGMEPGARAVGPRADAAAEVPRQEREDDQRALAGHGPGEVVCKLNPVNP
jgi:hypothetical protein